MPVGEAIVPDAQKTIPEIKKTPITREVAHSRALSWGRTITTIDDCAAREEDATAVAGCG
jgi:hypothetical protein